MIIIGYQGIGKSTLAGKNKCIDLESGNFWFHDTYDNETYFKTRHANWYIPYCNIANHLSEQGYIVFTSSHKVVRNELKKSKEDVFIIYPSIELKDEWIKKLEDRYNQTGLDKDYKALMNAKDRYEENIEELRKCGLSVFEILDMDYSLDEIVRFLEGLN